jgi:hypothetical protein
VSKNSLTAAIAQCEAVKENPKKREPAELAVIQAKAVHKAALERTKAELARMIETRDRFLKFKIRRLRSAWITYGNAMKKLTEDEIEKFGEVRSVLQGFRIAQEELPAEVGRVESAIVQAVEAAEGEEQQAAMFVEEALPDPDYIQFN